MARRQRPLDSQLRQRELGIRRAGPDAAAHRQHQRPPHRRKRAQVSLAARPPPRRSPVAQRAWAIEAMKTATSYFPAHGKCIEDDSQILNAVTLIKIEDQDNIVL